MIYGKVLLLNHLNFFLELFVIQLILMFREKKRSHYLLRLLLCFSVGSSFYFLPSLTVSDFDFSFLIVFFISSLLIYFLYDVKLLDLVSGSFSAFAIQNITWNLFLLLIDIIGEDISQALAITLYLTVYLIFYLFYTFLFQWSFRNIVRKNNWLICLTGAMIVSVTFVLSSFVNGTSWTMIDRIYEIMCCMFALTIHYGVSIVTSLVLKEKKLEQDQAILHQMLHQQAKQQTLTKETVNLINLKCHDLKKQIKALRYLDYNERNALIGEITNAVNIYGSIAKTGNEALDLILTEKSLLCESKHIVIRYMVDPVSLSLMDSLDIWSLFGNALDNAIEAVEKEAEEQRAIRLDIRRKNQFLIICIENFCSRKIDFSDGLPITGKDTSFHGYGTKSILYVVSKYGGNCTLTQDDGIFRVNILFPLSSVDNENRTHSDKPRPKIDRIHQN